MTTHSASIFQRHPRAAKGLLAAAVLVVFDVTIASLLSWNRERLTPNIKVLTPGYEYGLKPGVDAHSVIWGHRLYRLRTNSLGFRDATSREVPLRTDARRILFIGDSFTMGIGCDYGDTFVGRIDRALAAQGYDVLNAAVDGYSTIHYRRKVRHFVEEVGLDLDWVVCCIDLSDIVEDLWWVHRHGSEEDIQVASEMKELPPLTFRRSWKSFLRSHSLLIDLAFRIRLALKPDLPLGEHCALWSTDEEAFERHGRPGLEIAGRNMDRLHRFLNERGIGLTMVVYPWPDQIVRNDVESRQVVFWRAWAAERDVRFINCFPALCGKHEDPMDALDAWFIRGDAHFNERGHKVMAEAILDGLRRE